MQAVADELLRAWAATILSPIAITPGSVLGGRQTSTTSLRPSPPIPASRHAAELAAGIERIFSAAARCTAVLIDGVRETIAELKRRGFRLGLATNDSTGGLEASLAPHGILACSTSRPAAIPAIGAKPGPGMALRLLRGCRHCSRPRPPWSAMPCTTSPWAVRPDFALNIGVLSGTSGREDLEDFADLILASVNDMPALVEFQA